MKAAILLCAVVATILYPCNAAYYFVVPNKCNMHSGVNYCKQYGGEIASWDNPQEFAQAKKVCKNACENFDGGNGHCGCWTGLRDDGSENKWYHYDGTQIDQSWGFCANDAAVVGTGPWHNGEPNDWGHGEDCTHIWRAQNYNLNDVPCGNSYMTLCKAPESRFDDYFGVDQMCSSQYEGEKLCSERGGHLVTFQNDIEFQIASQKCEYLCNDRGAGNNDCGCWTGLRDDKGENQWYNTDGSPRGYAMNSNGNAYKSQYPWHHGEPNNLGNEDCAHIWRPQGFDLNDIKCTDHGNFPLCREAKSKYFAISTWCNWETAKTLCEQHGGVIASFHSHTDYNEAKNLCKQTCEQQSPGNGDCGCFTGVKRQAPNQNIFYNHDGSARDYLMQAHGCPNTGQYPWHSGEPNNHGGEDCTHIWKPQGYDLNDIKCSDSNYAICERLSWRAEAEPGLPMPEGEGETEPEAEPVNDWIDDLQKPDDYSSFLQYPAQWKWAFVAIIALLVVNVVLMTYNNCCGKQSHKYRKVVMMGSDTEVDIA